MVTHVRVPVTYPVGARYECVWVFCPLDVVMLYIWESNQVPFCGSILM